MNKRDIIHDYNEDNPHVLDMLIKEIVKQEDDQVILGNRLMMLCQVNQAWKAAVDRYFSQCEALTIEVFFSKPTDFEEEANNTPSILHNEEFTHVQDIAGEFGRLSALSKNDVAFEVKGPLLRVHFERLPALLRSFREGVGVDYQTGEQLQMKTRTLSLVIIDRYRHQRTGPSVVGDPLDAYQPLFDMEALFSPAHLEALYLTVRLSELSASFFEALIRGMVERRLGGAFRSFDLHIPQLTIPKENSLLLLVLQLEHFGLNCRKLFGVKVLLEMAYPAKLRSLKLHNRFWVGVPLWALSHPSPAVVSLFAGLTTLELSVCIEMPYVNILMTYCKTLVSLKLFCTWEDYSNDFDFTCLWPVAQSLRHLTLVNFDLKNQWDWRPVVPELTTLTVVNHRHLLNDFSILERPFERGADYPDQPVDLSNFVRRLRFQFPRLERLTLIGAVLDHRIVRQQLTERLMIMFGEQLTQLQLHFVEHPNRRRSVWKEGPRKSRRLQNLPPI